MAEYLEVAEARARSGVRLVLAPGVPGPWGEGAKGVLRAKGIPFVRVRQIPGEENPALRAWTGHENAPVVVADDEPACTTVPEIVFLAERIAPTPSLLPQDPEDRAAMWGCLHEICGESGLGWCRRLTMLDQVAALGLPAEHPIRQLTDRLGRRYGYSPEAAAAAPARVIDIIEMLASRLRRQRDAGRRFLAGDSLSALDIYWATFAAMLSPLPDALCAMPATLRSQYAVPDGPIRDALDPVLLEHRDFVYREYLELPIDL